MIHLTRLLATVALAVAFAVAFAVACGSPTRFVQIVCIAKLPSEEPVTFVRRTKPSFRSVLA